MADRWMARRAGGAKTIKRKFWLLVGLAMTKGEGVSSLEQGGETGHKEKEASSWTRK